MAVRKRPLQPLDSSAQKAFAFVDLARGAKRGAGMHARKRHHEIVLVRALPLDGNRLLPQFCRSRCLTSPPDHIA